MDCKLICLDIDGTLLNSEHQVTAYTKEMIQKASHKGIPVVLVSARMPKAMTFIGAELGLQDPIVSYGGALVMKGEEVISNDVINPRVSSVVLQLAMDMNVHTSVYKGDDWYVQSMDSWALQEGKITNLTPTVYNFSELFQAWKKEETGPNKILLMAEPLAIKKMMERLSECADVEAEVYRSKDTYLEIMPKGVGKKEVVESLCQFYQISTETVLAVGDNDNDKQMLKIAGVGAAMGNARSSVKACADFITKSNDEDGVGYAIEKFVFSRPVKLVAVDMDGTALQPDKTLSPVTIDAIKHVVDQGILVVPASGRTYAGIPEELLSLGLPYVISANGGVIQDTKTGAHIYENEIGFEDATLLLAELKNLEGLVYIQYEDRYYQDRAYIEQGNIYHPFAGLPEEGIVDDLLGFVIDQQESVQKIGILLFEEQMEQKALDLQNQFPELKVLKTDHLSVEFNAKTASKGEALGYLAKMLEIEPDELMAIGDSENDLTMIQLAGKSVAMGNAMDSIKEAAVYQTKSNKEYGVAWALKYIL